MITLRNKKAQVVEGAIAAGILSLLGIVLKQPFFLFLAVLAFLFMAGTLGFLFMLPPYMWIIIVIVMFLWLFSLGSKK